MFEEQPFLGSDGPLILTGNRSGRLAGRTSAPVAAAGDRALRGIHCFPPQILVSPWWSQWGALKSSVERSLNTPKSHHLPSFQFRRHGSGAHRDVSGKRHPVIGKKWLDSVEVMRWKKKEKSPQLIFMSCEKVQRETLKGFYNYTKPCKEHLTH